MIKNKIIQNPFLIVLGIVFLISISIPSHVEAQGIVRGDNLTAGTTLAGDAIFHGESVTIDGNVDGDVLAIANEVEINGRISGSLVVLGNEVTINSGVGGTVYAAAVQFDLGPESNLSRNLYFGGLSLSTKKGSQIQRDLYSATMGAQLNGLVDGEIRAIIGPAEFFFLIMKKIDQQNWLELNEAPIRANSIHNQGTDIKDPDVVFAGFVPVLIWEAISIQQAGGFAWEHVGDWLLARFQEWLVLLIFGLLGLWLMPKWLPRCAQLLQSRPLPAVGWGLLGVVISFNLIGVVVLMLIIIIAIGFFLGMIAFWQLAWSFMAIGGFSLGLFSTAFALIVIYISKAIVAFLVGVMILNRIAPSYAGHNPLALITGLVIYVLLASIPILGWVIALLATVLGLGAVWLFYKDWRVQSKMSEMGITGEMTTI